MSLPLSTIDVLEKLKAGEDISVCEIFGSGQLEGQRGQEARLAALISWLTRTSGSGALRQLVEPLGYPIAHHTVEATDVVGSIGINPSCTRVSITANGADIRFGISGLAGGIFIANGTTKDFRVYENTTFYYIRAGTTNGYLEITELA